MLGVLVSEWALSHPLGSKQELAEWMGYETVEEMDAEHDSLHLALCVAFRSPSYSIMIANGRPVTPEEETLAKLEEHAVLMVQRWLQHLRKHNEDSGI